MPLSELDKQLDKIKAAIAAAKEEEANERKLFASGAEYEAAQNEKRNYKINVCTDYLVKQGFDETKALTWAMDWVDGVHWTTNEKGEKEIINTFFAYVRIRKEREEKEALSVE